MTGQGWPLGQKRKLRECSREAKLLDSLLQEQGYDQALEFTNLLLNFP